MLIPKIRPWRNQDWLNDVRDLPCVITGFPADDAHHIIGEGFGGMGTKAHDFLTMPVTRSAHGEIHVEAELKAYQSMWVMQTWEQMFCVKGWRLVKDNSYVD